MPRTVPVSERQARLARRHLLLEEDRTDAVASIADAVVALHSTDPVTVHLSAMARMRHPSVGAVEQALYDDRAVVRHHAMRRTLWVATPEMVRLMHAAATRTLVDPERRRTAKLLADNGVEDPDRWLDDARDQVVATLEERGPLTARELGVAVPGLTRAIVMAPGKSYSATVSAHTRVLLNLGFEGRILRTRPTGTWVNGAYRYAATDRWLDGGLGDLDERSAAGELALRWLRRFGPATAVDLQWWMGWTVARTKTALADSGAVACLLEDEEAHGDDGGVSLTRAGWLAPGDEDPVEPVAPWLALLPSLDPTTMGWKQRGWYLPARARHAFDRMGNAGPTIWVDGRVVGVWSPSEAGEVRTHLFDDLPAETRAAIAQRAAALADTVGGATFTVRFPSPVSTALAKGTAVPGPRT